MTARRTPTKAQACAKAMKTHKGRCQQCRAPHGEGIFVCRIGQAQHRVYWCDGMFYEMTNGARVSPGKPPAARRYVRVRLGLVDAAGGQRLLCQLCRQADQKPARDERRRLTGRHPGRPRKSTGQLSLL